MNVFKSFKKLFKVNNTYNNAEWIKLADFLGIDRNLDRDTRSEVTYFACLKILSEAIGKLPLKLMKGTAKDGVSEAKEHKLYNVLKNRPNKYMTATTFKTTIEQLRNHYGNAYVYIDYSKNNIQLIPLQNNKMTLLYDDAKILSQVPEIWYEYDRGDNGQIFSSEEILHFKSSHTFDGILGLSIRDTLKSTIENNKKAQRLQGDLYDSGFTAKAVLQYTGNLKDDSVRNFVSNIEKYAKGEVDKTKGIIPIPLGSQLTPLNGTLGDNQFLDLKRYTSLQIASAFGIKPVQINDYTKSSYSSSESQNLAFLVDTLMVIITQYEEELNYKLLTNKEIEDGYFFKFNTGALLRADLKTQVESLTKGISSFLYTPNEARAFLDLKAIDGADRLVGNGSTIDINQVGSQWKTQNNNDEGVQS